MTQQYRQGDILVQAVSSIPAQSVPAPRDGGQVVLAYGEATGHRHAIADRAATLFVLEQAQEIAARRWLQISGTEAVALAHAEHATIMLPPGLYEVRIQREYQPDAIRLVAD